MQELEREACARKDRSQAAGFEGTGEAVFDWVDEGLWGKSAPRSSAQNQSSGGASLAACNNRNAGTFPQHWTPKCLIPENMACRCRRFSGRRTCGSRARQVACALDSALLQANRGGVATMQLFHAAVSPPPVSLARLPACLSVCPWVVIVVDIGRNSRASDCSPHWPPRATHGPDSSSACPVPCHMAML